MSSSSPPKPRSLKRLSQKRTVAPHRPILAAIPGALRPSTACWMIRARRTSPAPSFCERVIRASLCASASLNARTRSVMATSPARTSAPRNAPASEKSHPTCRMHHLDIKTDIEECVKSRDRTALVNAKRPAVRLAEGSQPALDQRRVGQNPAVQGGVVHRQAALPEQLLDVAVAQTSTTDKPGDVCC